MNQQMFAWDYTANTSGDEDITESSQNHGNASNSMLPDSGVSRFTSGHKISDSLSIGASTEDDDIFQNVFGMYSSLQHHPTLQGPRNIEYPKEIAIEADKGESSERQRNYNELENWKCRGEEIVGTSQEHKRKQNEQPKPKRSREMHTLSERRRRERIRGKIRALQELIPNCNKDTASILDDAINYLKSLKLQVEMMSMGGGALFQVPYMPTAGIQRAQVTAFSPFMHIRPGIGIGMDFRTGMFGMSFSTGFPTMPAPLPAFQSPISAAALLPLMSGTRNIPLPQLQMPFIHSELPAAADPPTMLPNFLADSLAFNYSSQGKSSSQNMPSSSIDCQQMPITSQSHNKTSSVDYPVQQGSCLSRHKNNRRKPQMQQSHFKMPRF